MEQIDSQNLFCEEGQLFTLKGLAIRFPTILRKMEVPQSLIDDTQERINECASLIPTSLGPDFRNKMTEYPLSTEIFNLWFEEFKKTGVTLHSCKLKLEELLNPLRELQQFKDDKIFKGPVLPTYQILNQLHDIQFPAIEVLRTDRLNAMRARLFEVFSQSLLQDQENLSTTPIFEFESQFNLSKTEKIDLRKKFLSSQKGKFLTSLTQIGPSITQAEGIELKRLAISAFFDSREPSMIEFLEFLGGLSTEQSQWFWDTGIRKADSPETIHLLHEALNTLSLSQSENNEIYLKLGLRLIYLNPNFSHLMRYIEASENRILANWATVVRMWSAIIERVEQPQEMVILADWLDRRNEPNWNQALKEGAKVLFFKRLVRMRGVTTKQIVSYGKNLFFSSKTTHPEIFEAIEEALQNGLFINTHELADLFSIFSKKSLEYSEHIVKRAFLLQRYSPQFFSQHPSPKEIEEFVGQPWRYPQELSGLKMSVLDQIKLYMLDQSAEDQLEFLTHPFEAEPGYKEIYKPVAYAFLSKNPPPPMLFKFKRSLRESSLAAEVSRQIAISKASTKRQVYQLFFERLGYEESLPNENKAIEERPKTCSICYDGFTISDDLGVQCKNSKCAMVFCEFCMKTRFNTKELGLPSVIKCPECQTDFDLSGNRLELLGITPEALLDLQLEEIVTKYEKKFGSLRPCSAVECPYYFHKGEADSDNIVKCLVCSLKMCFLCGSDSHAGMTCEEFKSGSGPYQEMIEKKIIQFCPDCQTPSIRISNCSHVKCKKCKKDWTYEGEFREVDAGWQ